MFDHSVKNHHQDFVATNAQALSERHCGRSLGHAAFEVGDGDGRCSLGIHEEIYRLSFDTLIRHCASDDPARQHCIVTSGLLEDIDDTQLNWTLTSRWQASHEMLRTVIERGQHDGSIANRAPSAELAEVLMALTAGLRVAARAGRSQAQMLRLVAITLGVLDQVESPTTFPAGRASGLFFP